MKMHKTLLKTALVGLTAVLLLAGCERGLPPVTEEMRGVARGVHARVVTLDTHADIDTADFTAARNYTMDLDTQVTLPKMEAGGLDVAWFIVYTAQGDLDEAGYEAAYANAIDKFDAIHRLAGEIAPERIEVAYDSADVRRIVGSGKLAAMIGIENAYPLGPDLSHLADFHARGGRYMSLAHNGHNQFSDSHTGEEDDDWLHGGLSDLGREAVAEMNRLGIIIDVSHPSKAAIAEMLALSRAPVMASHSSARGLSEHSRNLDDEQLRAIRDNGGVVHAVALDAYLNAEKHARYEAAQNLTVSFTDTGNEFLDSTLSTMATMTAGANTATFAVTAFTNDVDDEGGTVTVTLSAADAGTDGYSLGSTNIATLTINDDESIATLNVENATATEIYSSLAFVVTLTPASNRAVSVSYATANGSPTDSSAPSATAGDDYTATNGTLNFASGETKKTISVPVLNDMLDEPATEHLTLTLSAATNASPQGGNTNLAATGSIIDDDVPELSIAVSPTTLASVAPPVDVGDFVDHIDYMVEVMGIRHVGISSDFDGGGGIEGWRDASETFNVTLELVRRGYSEEEIALLWSGNLLRVLDEVQAIAATLQAED